jgi:hypothetical protein
LKRLTTAPSFARLLLLLRLLLPQPPLRRISSFGSRVAAAAGGAGGRHFSTFHYTRRRPNYSTPCALSSHKLYPRLPSRCTSNLYSYAKLFYKQRNMPMLYSCLSSFHIFFSQPYVLVVRIMNNCKYLSNEIFSLTFRHFYSLKGSHSTVIKRQEGREKKIILIKMNKHLSDKEERKRKGQKHLRCF